MTYAAKAREIAKEVLAKNTHAGLFDPNDMREAIESALLAAHTAGREEMREEVAREVKSFWLKAEYDCIGDADVLESVCAQASDAIRSLPTRKG